MTITVAIPTYRREQTLLDTIEQILALKTLPLEILVVDQTLKHSTSVTEQLQTLAAEEQIRWLRLDKPSIPAAMNHALCAARGNVVLFLDDDIELTSEIVAAHYEVYRKTDATLVAGQVIQSWQRVLSDKDAPFAENRQHDPDAFLFNSSRQCWVTRFIGCNFSIKKEVAIQLGGFDENFVKVAYRFEAEFADRLAAAGYGILFYPQASIRHLKAATGGTRSYGDHLTSLLPSHSVGRYYYLLVAKNISHRLAKILTSPFTAIKTRFHLFHPWWIPVSFTTECTGLFWAVWLYIRGPRYITERDCRK